jgi:hypothetical protein
MPELGGGILKDGRKMEREKAHRDSTKLFDYTLIFYNLQGLFATVSTVQ